MTEEDDDQFDWDLLLANKSAEEQWVVFKSVYRMHWKSSSPNNRHVKKEKCGLVVP